MLAAIMSVACVDWQEFQPAATRTTRHSIPRAKLSIRTADICHQKAQSRRYSIHVLSGCGVSPPPPLKSCLQADVALKASPAFSCLHLSRCKGCRQKNPARHGGSWNQQSANRLLTSRQLPSLPQAAWLRELLSTHPRLSTSRLRMQL